MIGATERMSLYIKELGGLLKDGAEFAVLVQNQCVKEPVSELHFHNGRCERRR